MKKKFLVGLLLCLCTIFCAIGFVACNGDDNGSADNRDKQIVFIYNTYVAYAEENGQTPLSYKEWLNSIKGKDGINGLNGKDGLGVKSVIVNDDGHLIITYTDNNFVDAGFVKGTNGQNGQAGKDGNDGADGFTPYIKDGYWWIGENNTNVKAEGVDGKDGENGQDGVAPTISISEDGYWVINGQKKDMKAVGVDGKDGKDGNDGADGLTPYIKDGYWWIGETNTNVKAQGTDGQAGKDGEDGKDGREIKSAEIDAQGNLIITYKDDTTENLGKIKDNSKCEHEYENYIIIEIGDIGYRKEYYCKKCHEEKSELYIYTEGIEYALSEDGESAYVKSIGTATDKEIVLRRSYQGKPVTKIGDSAFDNNTFIESVILSDSIKEIGARSFYDCSSLKSIVLGKSLSNINFGFYDYYSFRCSNLTTIKYNGTIDEWCKIKGLYVLTWYSNIEKLYFNNVLMGEEITIEKTNKIEEYAFHNLKFLKKVNIGRSVKTIGTNFLECDSLKIINYLGTIDEWCEIGDEEYKNNGALFYSASIGPAYGKASQIDLYINDVLVTEVNITSATKITGHAFMGCEKITSVNIGDSVKIIGVDAFSGCISITSIEIPEGVEEISDAFRDCENLKSITIPNSLKKWYGYIYGCNSLNYNEYDNALYLGNAENPYLILVKAKNNFITSCEINNNCRFISNSAFHWNNFESINIPSSVIYIGIYAFSGCHNLHSVEFSKNSHCSVIDDSAFNYCTSLTNFELPISIKTIGNGVFNQCDLLAYIYYGSNANDFDKISIDYGYNECLLNATVYFYSEEEPQESGNYWYYDASGEKVLLIVK